MKSALLFAILALTLTGCAEVIASNEIANGVATSKAHAEFHRKLEGENLARRDQGLSDLDSCSEKFWFDRGWALKDHVCGERIKRWEFGDSSALNPPGMVLARTRQTVPDSVQRVYDQLWQRRADSAWVHESN